MLQLVIQITIRNAARDIGYNLALIITSSYDNYSGLRYIPGGGKMQSHFLISFMPQASVVVVTMGDTDTHRDVKSVVQNVVNSPRFRSLIADVIESSNHTANLTQTTLSNISHSTACTGSQPVSTNVAGTSVTTASTFSNSSRTTYANPVAEFNAIFRRGASTGQQQQGGGTVASFLPGIAPYTARSRSRNTSRTSRGRRSSSAPPASASAASKPKANNVFTREVVLLSSPTASNVVKGKKKAELLREGQVISSFDFYRSWTEEDVYRHLGMAFQDKLHGKRYV